MYKSEWNKLDPEQKKEIKEIFERGKNIENKIEHICFNGFFFEDHFDFCNGQGMSEQGFIKWIIERLKLDQRRKKIEIIRKRSSELNDYSIF